MQIKRKLKLQNICICKEVCTADMSRESGKSRFGAVLKLADLYDVTTDYLLGRTNEKHGGR